ncbi:peptidoglycan DD-metalloendopeptidase family protein [Lysobacter sp. FW306-1B-D06B]|uniref:peptidoglycan DD-metalloendopeptidase family protein n=1 Tax=Lysobacter sp. FW306-1B-D06B TaxID=3140250 RepID=UPI00314047AE
MRHFLIAISCLCLCACTLVKVYPAAPTAAAAAAEGDGVVVQMGDSLYGIARRHGVNVRDLAEANAIQEPFLIHPGQRLHLPTTGATPAVPAPVQLPSTQATQPSVRTEPLPDTSVSRHSAANDTAATKAAESKAAAVKAAEAKAAAAKAAEAKVAAKKAADAKAAAKEAADAKAAEVKAAATKAAQAKAAAAKAEAAKAAKPATVTQPTPASDELKWQWPANGTLLNMPASHDAIVRALDIAGAAGTPVRAAAGGQVLYAGEGSPGYEQLIVIKHDDGWVSSYAHSRRQLVVEGQRVAAGAVIAEMGRVGAKRDMVHFELRHDGDLVDPRDVLPER